MIESITLRPDAIKLVEYISGWGELLTAEDDPNFWIAAASVVMRDAAFLTEEQPSGSEFYLHIGSCSHWCRPHQTRWTANGGFAWPSGYNGVGYSASGLPQMDWCIPHKWYPKHQVWGPIGSQKFEAKRKFVLRAALPARTARHGQAVVNAIWQFGTPHEPRKKSMTMYGFRKTEGTWNLTAWSEWDDARNWQ